MKVRVLSSNPAGRKGGWGTDDDTFSFKQIPGAFTSLPRVLRLVWSTHAPLTFAMGLLSLAQGFTPVASVWITSLVIDSVVRAALTHTIGLIWLPILLQLAITLLSSLLSTLSNITQQLLQELVSNCIQLMILEKADTLDLSFFENPEFYDKLRQATDQSTYQPVSMISQTFSLCQTMVTLLSMLVVLLHLAWWLALIALITPIPAFFSSTRYGWRGYQRQRRQSPERRQMAYFINVMTVDTYNKEIKLFNLGGYFIKQFKYLANKIYEENKGLLVARYLTNFGWGALTGVANSGIYLYVAIQAVLGRITIGGLSLYTQSAVQVGQNFQGFLNGISSTYENNLYISMLFEFLEYQPSIVSPALSQKVSFQTETKGLDIEFRHVSFTYPDKDPVTQAALRDVSFTI